MTEFEKMRPSTTTEATLMMLAVIGGSLGTFFSGLGWSMAGWIGVCLVGGFFACSSLALSAYERYKIW